MTTFLAREAASPGLSDSELRAALEVAFRALGERRRVLAVPPDLTRHHSFAGRITELAWEHWGDRLTDVLPALGTHAPMAADELTRMFGRIPLDRFRVHRFREDVETLGSLPPDEIGALSEGRLSYAWPAQVNRLVARGGHDLVLCAGQVVPHEVAGLAGGAKLLLVGAGGREAIDGSHWLGAVFGMERIMGRAENPVRALFDRAWERFAAHLPVVHVLTVVAPGPDGRRELRGLFVGDDRETFARAAALSRAVNIKLLDAPIDKMVVYLEPAAYRSTWLGNKAIYRTRMAIADGGELVVLAPGVRRFGEDPAIDALIRRYGYRTSGEVQALVERHEDLRASLSAAAHLVHGSPEGRFRVTYCPGGLGREEIERAGFAWGDLAATQRRYDPSALREGWNELPGGERIWFVANPGLGLWAHRARFEARSP